MNRNARGSILDRIVETKRAEVALLRKNARALRTDAEQAPRPRSFGDALRSGAHVAVIAEVKRRSPSAGEIRTDASAEATAVAYAQAGASAISVLTDKDYFGGSLDDLRAVVREVRPPVLRKDFTIDALQLYEAKIAGAAAVLLIVRILDDAQLRDLQTLSLELGLGALIEVHDEWELERALVADAGIVGVNNRDLATFTTDLATTERLAHDLPKGVTLVAESGIASEADVIRVADVGADAVLVGEALMKAPDPAELLAELASVGRRR